MRKPKKGFTIVELVIVIAVIAVLTAVLVPTFIHLSSKAKDSIDKTVVKNANIQLAAKEGLEGKNRSMSDAVKDVDEIGYHIPGVKTANGNKIVWDSESDRFVLFDKDNEVLLKDSNEVSAHSKLFYAVSSLEAREDFAVYAKSDFSGSTEFTSPISFDAGDKEGITSISYEFSAVAEVLVATNSQDTVLTVNAPSATFKHDNLVGKEYVKAVDSHSFSEFGKVGFAKIESGHYVADEGSNVKGVFVTSNDAVVDQKNGGVIAAAYGEDPTVTNTPGNVDLSYDKNESQTETKAMKDLDYDINPPAGAIEVTQTNYSTVFTADQHNYILAENIEIMVRAFTIPADCDVTLDLNGHNINCNYEEFDLDMYYDHVADTDFIDTVSALVNFGKLNIIGNGTIGGNGGWFGIRNHGEITLNGCIVRGGLIATVYGFNIAFSPIASDDPSLQHADGYKFYNDNTAYDSWVSGKSTAWTYEPERA